MKTIVLSKPETQRLIKNIRSTGLKVEKIPNGYKCQAKLKSTGEYDLLFQAMTGRNGYLIRYQEEFLTKIQ